MGLTWEREYFRLAAVVLNCRLHAVEAARVHDKAFDQVYNFLGEMDYSAEMGKVLQEVRASVSLMTSSSGGNSR